AERRRADPGQPAFPATRRRRGPSCSRRTAHHGLHGAPAVGSAVEADDQPLADGAVAREASPPPRPRRRRGRPSRARGQPNSPDAAATRWTIRGVPPHIREMAVRRAAERGMTVGDWLAEAIVGFVRAADKAQAERTNLPATEAPPDMAQ